MHIEFQSKGPRFLCNGYSSHWPVFTQWLVSIAHFPNAQVDTWHALAIEMKAEVMYLPSAGKRLISGTGKPCFWRTLLGYVLQFFFFFFFFWTNWKFVATLHWESLSSKFAATAFPTAFARFVSVSCFGNSCNITNFSFLSSLLWWSVISDLWCYYYNCFGEPQTTPW